MKPDVPHGVKSAVSWKARTDPSLGGGETHPRESFQYNGKERKERMRFQGLVLLFYSFYNEEFPSDDFSLCHGGPHNI